MHLGVDKEWFKFKNTVVIIKIQPFLLMKNKSIQQTRNAVLLSTILSLSNNKYGSHRKSAGSHFLPISNTEW
jgi:hypothetical protein